MQVLLAAKVDDAFEGIITHPLELASKLMELGLTTRDAIQTVSRLLDGGAVRRDLKGESVKVIGLELAKYGLTTTAM
jgi:hypothetical protein